MDNDDELRKRGMTRRTLQTGYAWIAAGLLLLGVVLALVVGILYVWITGR